MKRLIITALLAIGLHAENPLLQRFTDPQILDIGIAGIECFDRHPILRPQAGEVLVYAMLLAKSDSTGFIDAETFEDAVYEVGAFRRNVKKLCGHYQKNAINNAFLLTSKDLLETYTLLGYLALIAVITNE